jgi:uncharacterized protein YraI
MTAIKFSFLAAAATLALQSSAFALPATVTGDVAVRTGPGPNFPVIGVIARAAPVEVQGCVHRGMWCQIAWNGQLGWTYATYLAHEVQGRMVALPEARTQVEIPTVVYEETQPAPPTMGTLGTLRVPLNPPQAAPPQAAPPQTAMVSMATTPPPEVRTYVMTQKVEPVYLEGEAVVDATLPNTVQLHPVPNYRYRYAYVNGSVVLADPNTYRIVHVFQ